MSLVGLRRPFQSLLLGLYLFAIQYSRSVNVEECKLSDKGYCSLETPVEHVRYDEHQFTLQSSVGTSNQQRRLEASDPMSFFRSIPSFGLLGHHEGGIFKNFNELDCAIQCTKDPLCLSFDIEVDTQACYISHVDRYSHPEAFLAYPSSIHYEWQGSVDNPKFEPDGIFVSPTQIIAKLSTSQLGATIYYRIEAIIKEEFNETTDQAESAAIAQISESVENFTVLENGNVIVLPPYPCRLNAVAKKEGMNDSSLVTSKDYNIHASKYFFMVPYFGGEYHGNVVRIQLDSKGKKRPRPARYQEFSDYNSENGIGPYEGQISVIDLQEYDSRLVGFRGGFTSFVSMVYLNETYWVPAKDDPNYQALEWRIVLKDRYDPHADFAGWGVPSEIYRPAEFVYLSHYYSDGEYQGGLVRIMVDSFNLTSPIIEYLQLSEIEPYYRGYSDAIVDDSSNIAFMIPDRTEEALSGVLAIVNLTSFSSEDVISLNLTAMNAAYAGFSAGFIYERWLYLVPYERDLKSDEASTNLREFPVDHSGLAVRIHLDDYSIVESFDLTSVHSDLVGFSGAVVVGHHAYFVPYQRRIKPSVVELNVYSGLLAKVDLRTFKTADYLDLAKLDDSLRGFQKGFSYKQYVFLVPHRSKYYEPGEKAFSGKVVRIDTNNFDLENVSVLDLTAAYRGQVPDRPDEKLRGFSDGVVSGKYGYFIPYFNGLTYSGRVCRINLEMFDEVQTMDLQLADEDLKGFSGAIVSKAHEELAWDPFSDFEMRVGTDTPYKYIY